MEKELPKQLLRPKFPYLSWLDQPVISYKSFFMSKKQNYRDEMKSLSYDYAQQPTWAICHYPIDSYEYRKLVFLIHKSIFVYAANSQFGPTSGSFCY